MSLLISETNLPTLISEGTRITGSLTFLAEAQVLGIVEGDICQQANQPLRLGRVCWVKGNVISEGPVIIEGRVDGNVRSSHSICLTSSAVVQGHLDCPTVRIQGGARFDGELEMRAA